MPYIQWIESLSVGVREIDDQHRVLIDGINELAAAREQRRGRESTAATLASLEGYVDQHFGLEERYFREFDYPERRPHMAEHTEFRRRIAEFREAFAKGEADLSEELLGFLRTWLTSHISFSDKKYRKLFLSRGLR